MDPESLAATEEDTDEENEGDGLSAFPCAKEKTFVAETVTTSGTSRNGSRQP